MTSTDARGGQADRGQAPRRRAVARTSSPSGSSAGCTTAPGRGHDRVDRAALRQERRSCRTPTAWPSRPATTSARRPSCSEPHYEVRAGQARRRASTRTSAATPPWPGGSSPPASWPSCRCSWAATRSRRRRDILHELSKHKNFGVRTMQAEDEIAGVGAALGAAFAGHLGVTTTSGPGVDLKAETIGLAISMELPLLHRRHPAGRPVHRPADQDRAGRPAAGHVRPPRRVAAADRGGQARRATASTPPSRRPASPSSTARR